MVDFGDARIEGSWLLISKMRSLVFVPPMSADIKVCREGDISGRIEGIDV